MSGSIIFKKAILAASIAAAIHTSHAAFVRNDIDYQYFRDFAENKGVFAVGASNVAIFNQQGQMIGTALPNVPMPNLEAIVKTEGMATLIDPQYVVSVRHNSGYQSVQFGDDTRSPDAHLFDYKLVARNEHSQYDLHTPRLHKMVTEVVPMQMSTAHTEAGANIATYLNKQRFPVFVRVGSGMQWQRDTAGRNTFLKAAYVSKTGGAPLTLQEANNNQLVTEGSVFDTTYGPIATYGAPGDSGSSLLAFDTKLNQWRVIAVTRTYTGEEGSRNTYTGVLPNEFAQTKANDGVSINSQDQNAFINWKDLGNGQSELRRQNANTYLTVGVRRGADLQHGKNISFNQSPATLVLQSNINQGAGALIFNTDFTVKPQSNQTWVGSGIVVEQGKQVNWAVANPKGDRISKLGQGRLNINGTGANQGSISVGDGTVFLNQNADASGRKQAFGEVGIVSGRPTVILADSNQVISDNIYFGNGGGRLDVNGNDIAFSRIQNVDAGAQIVNHNPNRPAEVLISDLQSIGGHKIEWAKWHNAPKTNLALYEYTNPYQSYRKDYFFLKGDPTAYFPTNGTSNSHWEYLGSDKVQAVNRLMTNHLPRNFFSQDIEWVQWSEYPTSKLALYEYINTHKNNRKDYFILKNNPKAYFPTDATSNEHWEFVGHDRTQAINKLLLKQTGSNYDTFNGYFGETDPNRPNGVLNVTYDSPKKLHLISGGTKLNGTLHVQSGSLLLSGRPMPHARDYQKNQDVIRDDEWLNRQFQANTFAVTNNGVLYSGRNVSDIQGNFLARSQGKIQLGFVQGKTPLCIRSDFSGETQCNLQAHLSTAIFNHIPSTRIVGNVDLLDNTQFTLGKAQLFGRINATPNTKVSLEEQSHWTMRNDSQLGHLSLNDGQITLNPAFATANKNSRIAKFNTLQVNGELNGYGRFNYLINAADSQGDRVVVNGLAKGRFELDVKNTGAEPNTVSPVSLLRLANPKQQADSASVSLVNHYVDLGAYRYILKNLNNDYRLYSPVRDAQIQTPLQTPNTAAYRRAVNWAKLKTNDVVRSSKDVAYKQSLLDTAKQKVADQERELAQKTADEQRARQNLSQPNLSRVQIRQLTTALRRAEANTRQARSYLNTVKNRESSQQRILNNALNSLEKAKNILLQAEQSVEKLKYANGREDIRTQAQKFCTQSQYSEQVCAEVAQNISAQVNANLDDLAVQIDTLNQATQAYEAALANLDAAKQSNDETQIRLAEEAVEYAANILQMAAQNVEQPVSLAAALADNLDLNTNPNQADFGSNHTQSHATQATWISQYTNTALSELSAQTNQMLRVGHNLDRQLLSLDKPASGSVWANVETLRTKDTSPMHRDYEQEQTNTQIGGELSVDDRLSVGAVFSHSLAQNDFADNYKGKGKLASLHAYAKASNEQGWFGTADLGYAHTTNRLDKQRDELARFGRDIGSIGVNAGKQWQLAGATVQPSAGVRYYHISGVDYELDQAQVHQDSFGLMSYHVGVKLGKPLQLGQFELTPTLGSQYVNTRTVHGNASKLSVNNHAFDTADGHYFNHELSLNAKHKQWQIAAHVGQMDGDEIGKQNTAGLKIGYVW
ncbi:S6 family peptidase [Moraxella marmotae]|uniref:S6 family peptidase n=1 Tax=Moraxella marmotae TaxID=3344520 RepID=UPI0035F2B536